MNNIPYGGGGGGYFEKVDLTRPSRGISGDIYIANIPVNSTTQEPIIDVDGTGVISWAQLVGPSNGTVFPEMELIIDGGTLWNDTLTVTGVSSGRSTLWGRKGFDTPWMEPMRFNSSFVLRCKSSTVTSVSVEYNLIRV